MILGGVHALNASRRSGRTLVEHCVPRPSALGDCGIVYFGGGWFVDNSTSGHHIVNRLVDRFPILYVEVPGRRRPSVNGKDFAKIGRTISQSLQPPRRVQSEQRNGMWLCTVPQLPFRSLPVVPWLNRCFGAAAVRKAIRSVGFKDFILWFDQPHPGFLAGHLGERFTVYHCIDDYAAFPDADREALTRMDVALTEVADQVFVAPPSLLREKQRLNATAEYAPHGVDVDLFAQASEPTAPMAAAAAGLKHPVIGFFGMLGAWIDVALMERIARSHPEWTLLIVGPVATDVSRLKALPNVVFSGPQPYAELPRWAKAFDVAIIPYLRNQQVMNANPLKLREYLATGKPIVSVSNPEIDRFAHCIGVARGADDFVAKIEMALTDDTPARSKQRRAAVMNMSWEARVDKILATVEESFRRKVRTA